jgi:hypothetical protein
VILVIRVREVAHEDMDLGCRLACAKRGAGPRDNVQRLRTSSGTGPAAWSRDTKRRRDRWHAARLEVLASEEEVAT